MKKENKTITVNNCGETISSNNNGDCTSLIWNPYANPILVKTIVRLDSIELIYKADSNIVLTTYPAQYPDPKVWKEIYGVVDGKFGIIKIIDGEYQAAQDEDYLFDETI